MAAGRPPAPSATPHVLVTLKRMVASLAAAIGEGRVRGAARQHTLLHHTYMGMGNS